MRKSLVLVAILVFSCAGAQAMSWDSLWLNDNALGKKLLDKGNIKDALESFTDPLWEGVGYYRHGDYEEAAELFAGSDSSFADYNRGNALAHLGRYQEAISAYDAALSKDPKNEDAQFNRELVKKLLQEKKNDNSQSPQNQNAGKNNQPSQPPTAKKNRENKAENKPAKNMPENQEKNMRQQSLRRIQDDPGGLLKQKFLRDYQRFIENR